MTSAFIGRRDDDAESWTGKLLSQ